MVTILLLRFEKLGWKIYVFSLVIQSGRKMTIGVKFEVWISLNEEEKTDCVDCIIARDLMYINGIQLAKCGLLIDRTL